MVAEATSRFATRSYSPGDEDPILDLFARSFHAPRSREHFEWKYLHNPWGNQHISVTFDDQKRLVGHYAGYPIPFVAGGRDLLAHQIGDTMTERSVRHVGRGPTSVLGRTAEHFYDTFCRDRMAFNYGFNVSNIQRFSLRFLRSTCVEPVPYRVRTSGGVQSTRPRWSRLLSRIEVGQVLSTDSEWDAFFQRVAPSYGFLVRRDAAYLRWRYLIAPHAQYVLLAARRWGRLAGWIACRVREGRISVGDALCDPAHEEILQLLLQHAIDTFHTDCIEGWFPERPHWWGSWLARAGFAAAPEPQDLSLMCVPFVMPEAPERMRESLYYTMGDSDLF